MSVRASSRRFLSMEERSGPLAGFGKGAVNRMKEIAITENHLYQKTYRRGARWSGKYVTVCVLKDLSAKRLKKANPQKQFVNRIGLSVPKREGGAVERNRVKRILREGLRAVEREHPLKKGFLVVISTRPGVEKQKSTVIAKELRYVFRKLDMLAPPSVPSQPREAPTPMKPIPSDGANDV